MAAFRIDLEAVSRWLSEISWTSTEAAIRQVLRSPQSNLPVTFLLASIASVVLLILVLSALFLVTGGRKKRVVKIRRYAKPVEQAAGAEATSEAGRGEGEAEGPDAVAQPLREPKARALSRAWGAVGKVLGSSAVIALLVVAGLVGSYVATSQDAFCAETCHGGSESVRRAAEVAHAPCIRCHEGSGVPGVVEGVVSRSRMALKALFGGTPTDLRASVPSDACAACHRSFEGEPATSTRTAVKMSHAEPTEAGRPCVSCHATTGHDRRAYNAGMSPCIVCHDGTQASAECSTCHRADPAATYFKGSAGATETVGSGKTLYPVVRAANRDCGKCHDVAKHCDPCHGLRMPHPEEFRAGGHAPVAAFERKRLCWRCHTVEDCSGRCHLSMGTDDVVGHADNWKTDHANSPRDSLCSCHAMKSGRTTPFCPVCHKR